MKTVSLMCRTATPFTRDGAIDEEALRKFLARFIDSGIGPVLASSGTGEGYALTPAEMRRVFEIGREECAGKVPVYGNPPEQHTAKMTVELAKVAAEAKVDFITIFALAGWHGMKPSDLELRAYYDTVLGAIKHPISLAVNPMVGYIPKVSIVADMCRRYTQVASVILTGVPDTYFIELKALVGRDIAYFTPLTGSLNMLALGCEGLFAAEANALPKTYRRYVNAYEQGHVEDLAQAYSEIKRFLPAVAPWSHANSRWVKMFMKAFKLPGGEGGLREPYQMPPAEEMQKFVEGCLRVGVPEITDQARAAGLL